MNHPGKNNPVTVLAGDAIARYGFGDGHPFGPDRQAAFLRGLDERGLPGKVRLEIPKDASRADVELFHSPHHIEFVEQMSQAGEGFLDFGDTPAFPGIFDAAMSVVGTTLRAGEMVMSGRCRRAFVPIAGLHHAARVRTSGFCVFNDCAVLIEALRKRHGIRRIAYVDIDAHHGDGVFYGFADDPDVLVADIHEDGRFLFPGTGHRDETGEGEAVGTKLNIPLLPGAGDEEFRAAWGEIETYLNEARPEFIILQCGADSIAGDPITHLQFSEHAHGAAAASLCEIADRFSDGRLVALGGGGYNRRNIATGWSRVVQEMVENT
ncbi:MAG: acetoin utilization protein AcuC [Chromatiales bacterium]|nr:acetoin utilization protein AcuC [Chromatiales bacterium]MDH4031095.1 acetoin utilization protein AcuC [Chromatiales bacterium]